MNKIVLLIFIFLFSFVLPVFSKEDDFIKNDEILSGKVKETVDNEDNPNPDIVPYTKKDEFKIYHSKFKRAEHKGKLSPKLEHVKTKIRTERGLFKRKEEFRQRKNNELELLQREYEILDYK